MYKSTKKYDMELIDINIPCRAACPVNTDVPGYIQAVMEGDYETAYKINRKDNVLPGVLGRVCNRPCENACRHGMGDYGDPVSICFLKRSTTDFGMKPVKLTTEYNGKTVCVAGSGPAGLTVANDLALKGYKVTVFEQFDEPGGMLRYGIPKFRLPHNVVEADIKSIIDLGVEIKTNVLIKDSEDIQRLQGEYDAVVFACGCMLPEKIDMPDMGCEGVIYGIDFIMSANRDNVKTTMGKVVVIGGGFTAVDCARMAYRSGADSVTLAYRRTSEDMYVGRNELEVMEFEEIDLMFSVSPVSIINRDGKVKGLKLIRNSITDNRKIMTIAGSEFVLDVDTVIFAIGQKANGSMTENMPYKECDNFFTAGDYRNGTSTVINAVADGRRTAGDVHRFLSKTDGYPAVVNISEVNETGRRREYDFIPAQEMNTTSLSERRVKNREVETGYTEKRSAIEARRCYLCHYVFKIDIDRCICCVSCSEAKPVDCIDMAGNINFDMEGRLHYFETDDWSKVETFVINNDKCIRCGACVRACPVNCISIYKYQLDATENR